MKSTKQIQDRITHLESRMKDGLHVDNELKTLEWFLLWPSEDDIKKEMISSISDTQKPAIKYIRLLCWYLED